MMNLTSKDGGEKTNQTEFDLVIIGGGPAGLTAGIYATRAMLNTLLIEKLTPGGQAASTDWVENYPGFEDGISGAELMKKMEEHSKKFGLKIISGTIESVNFAGEMKAVQTGDKQFRAKTVIIATGTEPRKLEIPGEEKFRGRGVSYCATCDGPFFKDADIAVIGAGSSGVGEGLFLLKFAKSISVVEFLPQMTAEKILQVRALKQPNMKFYLEHMITSINGENKVESITIKSRRTNEEKIINVQGVFIYVGLNPNTQFLQGKIKLDEHGYVITDEDTRTSVPGIFAAGDVRQKILRQIATAISDGAQAAFMAEKYVEEQKQRLLGQ